MEEIKIIDLHSHSFMSDGISIPSELIRYAQKNNYSYFSITDHVDLTNYKEVIDKILNLKDKCFSDFFIPGIEITHVHPDNIYIIVEYAQKSGIKWIGVHGETVIEPVIKGTNIAAIKAGVNFLAHPGFITDEELKSANQNNVFIELTLRSGHSLTNGYVYQKGKKAGVNFIISSDAHRPSELFTKDLYISTALGSTMTLEEFKTQNKILLKYVRENLI